MHDVIRREVVNTPSEMPRLSGIARAIYASRVPVPSVVACFPEGFQFNPLGIIPSGTPIASVQHNDVEEVSDAVQGLWAPFPFVGRVLEASGGHLLQGSNTVHCRQMRCEED